MKTSQILASACAGAAAAALLAAPPARAPTPGVGAVASATPALPQILDFSVVRLDLPVAAGQPIQVTVPVEMVVGAGQPFVLSLEPHSIRSPDFRLLVDEGDGQLAPVQPDPPRTLAGSVQGLPGSSVSASLIGGRLWASILTGAGESWSIEPLSDLVAGADPADHVVYRDRDVVPTGRMCGTPDGPGAVVPAGGVEDGIAGTGLKIAEIAADADVEYWLKNAGDVQLTMADIENVIAAAANIYRAEISLTFEVTTIVVRTGDVGSDPYSSAVCTTLLDQFRDTWAAPPESEIKRDLAQLFTGRALNCLGFAYLGGACDIPIGFGYSLVESQAAGLPFSQRTALTAHETGHTFNAPHCCGTACAGCINPPCNIMCLCIGGCSGNLTAFGPLSAPTIINYVNGLACLHPLPDPLIIPLIETFPAPALSPSTWIYIDGATASTLAGNEPSPPNAMLLSAFGNGSLYQDHEIRSNFINLAGQAGAGVYVRFATEHVGSEAGEQLFVDYWAGSAVDLWEPLAVLTSDGADQAQFGTTSVALDGVAPSPFHNQFRLRLRTDVDTSGGDATPDNWFVDDLFVGVPLAPGNDLCSAAAPVAEGQFSFTTDGAHTDGPPDLCGGGNSAFVNDIWYLYTPSCSGTATLSLCNAAGFDTRLAVYAPGPCPPSASQACSDNAAGCGQTSEVTMAVAGGAHYLVRVGATSGTGNGALTIACAAPCPWDLDGDDDVDVTDFLALLAAWGPNPGSPADFDGDGDVGTTDFLDVLAHWGPC